MRYKMTLKSKMCRHKNESRTAYIARMDKFAKQFAKQAGVLGRGKRGPKS